MDRSLVHPGFALRDILSQRQRGTRLSETFAYGSAAPHEVWQPAPLAVAAGVPAMLATLALDPGEWSISYGALLEVDSPGQVAVSLSVSGQPTSTRSRSDSQPGQRGFQLAGLILVTLGQPTVLATSIRWSGEGSVSALHRHIAAAPV